MIRDDQVEGKLGGMNAVVEIDECLIGCGKYNRARLIKDQWVVGMMIERIPAIRIYWQSISGVTLSDFFSGSS